MNEKWGVYIKEDTYYIARFMDSPIGSKEVDSFWAGDRKEALIKGGLIAEAHRMNRKDNKDGK